MGLITGCVSGVKVLEKVEILISGDFLGSGETRTLDDRLGPWRQTQRGNGAKSTDLRVRPALSNGGSRRGGIFDLD